MKVAILGSGFMGKTHAEALQQLPNINLVGILTTSRHPQSVEDFGTRVYTEFEQLMNIERPDVVSICLPTFLHKQYVMALADLGIHIICEKPLALSVQDAREMMAYCDKQQVRLFIGHVLHFFPEYRKLQADMNHGKLGELGSIFTRRVNFHPGVTSDWYNDDNKSGGVLFDLMIHDLDILRALAGEVDSIYAVRRKLDNFDFAQVTLTFTNGVIAHAVGGWGTPEQFAYSCDLFGNQGALALEKMDHTGENNPYYRQLQHFLHCIAEDQTPIITAADAYEAIILCKAAQKSIDTGALVLRADVND